MGDFAAWKPQKVGGCGWTRCPPNRILSLVAQDTAPAWVRGVGAHYADLRAFWRHFEPFFGRIVELKGAKGLFDTVRSSRTWCVATVSLRLGVLAGFGGYFWRKRAVFGPKLHIFGTAPPNLAPPPRGAAGESLAQNLDLARPLPRPQDGESRVELGAMRRSNGPNGKEKCLLVACCLLSCLLAG